MYAGKMLYIHYTSTLRVLCCLQARCYIFITPAHGAYCVLCRQDAIHPLHQHTARFVLSAGKMLYIHYTISRRVLCCLQARCYTSITPSHGAYCVVCRQDAIHPLHQHTARIVLSAGRCYISITPAHGEYCVVCRQDAIYPMHLARRVLCCLQARCYTSITPAHGAY